MVELVFWPGSLNARGYSAMLREAAAGGFDSLAISPLMVSELMAAGMRPDDIVAEARASGVALSTLDGVSSWASIAIHSDPLPAIAARFAFAPERTLEMAAALELDMILVAGAFDRGALAVEALIDPFGRFCDAAARLGIRVALDFVPFWGIPDLSSAWEIVRRADRSNGGLLIDSWHLQKGSDDFERDIALIATIPGDRLADLQLADALLAPQSDTLYGEGRFRRFAGDGELALDRIVTAIAAPGGLRRIGPEIFGVAADMLDAGEAGRRGGDGIRMLLDRIGVAAHVI